MEIVDSVKLSNLTYNAVVSSDLSGYIGYVTVSSKDPTRRVSDISYGHETMSGAGEVAKKLMRQFVQAWQ